MKIDGKPAGYLAYCSNIHPGETLDETWNQLRVHLPALKARLSPQAPFGVGLRLSATAARELTESSRLRAFREWLVSEGLYVFTMNGFPYGAFHGTRVKEAVYAPDWRTDERVAYTRDLMTVFSGLLPEGGEGSVSTSPLSYKFWIPEGPEREAAFGQCARRLAALAREMAEVEERTGRWLHLDLEPEPDCLLETSVETAAFFNGPLREAGGLYLENEYGMTRERAETLIRRHIQVCYDTCHFAVEFEDPVAALDRLCAAGIGIGKVQISAALRLLFSGEPADDDQVRRLEAFAESTYLHQVVERNADGRIRRYRDLPQALEAPRDKRPREWRIHFHVPVFAAEFGGLHSTREDIRDALEAVRSRGLSRHLEIETYTWDVLPAELKGDLLDSIEREYRWTLEMLGVAAGSGDA